MERSRIPTAAAGTLMRRQRLKTVIPESPRGTLTSASGLFRVTQCMEPKPASSISRPELSQGGFTMDSDRISGSTKNFAGKVEGTVGNLAGDRKTQAEGRVQEATGAAQNLYGQVKDSAREVKDAAASYAKDAYENSGDTFRDGSQAIASKVKENPLGSLLIAGGIGFALALLMSRPARRPPPRWR
jgi:uncharacterized protein YjbJ (UPF0337 family)